MASAALYINGIAGYVGTGGPGDDDGFLIAFCLVCIALILCIGAYALVS